VDEGIARLDLNLVLHTGLLMFGLAVIGAMGGMSNGIFTEFAVQPFGADMREALFRKVQSLSFGNLDELETGQLITRLTNDVTQVMEALWMLLRILVRAPLLLIGSLIMSIVTSPSLAFIPLVLMPIELVAVVWIVNKATPLYSLVQQKLDGLNEVMQENLAGVRVVKAFVRADHEKTRFGQANVNLTENPCRRRDCALPPYDLTMNFGIIAVLWFSGSRSRRGYAVGADHLHQLPDDDLVLLVMVSQMIIQLARSVGGENSGGVREPASGPE
jgi:ATP-binding cassette subfamily B protein